MCRHLLSGCDNGALPMSQNNVFREETPLFAVLLPRNLSQFCELIDFFHGELEERRDLNRRKKHRPVGGDIRGFRCGFGGHNQRSLACRFNRRDNCLGDGQSLARKALKALRFRPLLSLVL